MGFDMTAHAAGLWLEPHKYPTQGRALRYRTDIEGDSTDIPDVLDYTAIKRILSDALDGDAAALMQLSDEIEGRDILLQRVASTRRDSLTGMDYAIEPCEATTSEADINMAIEGADYIRGELANITTFEPVCLRGMAKAIGPNLAAIEIEWRSFRPRAFHWTDAARLTIDSQQSSDVRVITDEQPGGEIPQFAKFIMHTPQGVGANRFTTAITRGQAVIYVMKNVLMKNWATFAEIFGMPARIGTYNKATTSADRAKALIALRDMGARAYGLISEDIKFEMQEIARGTEPYSAMVEFLARMQAIGYLGQNLTTDTTGSGGLGGAGAAQIHEGVRRLITESDAKAEEWTLRATLFTWMLQFRFPDRWRIMPVPKFRRIWRDATTLVERAELIRKASQEIGLAVPLNWAQRELNIPDPDKGEGTIARIEAVAAAPFG